MKTEHIAGIGCLLVLLVGLLASIGIVLLLALGAHAVWPQFNYWAEAGIIYLLLLVLGAIFK